MNIEKSLPMLLLLLFPMTEFVSHAQDMTLSRQQQEELIDSKAEQVEEAEAAVKSRKEELEELQNAFNYDRPTTTLEILNFHRDEIELVGMRAYNAKNEVGERIAFPKKLKCSSVDFRTIHGCLELRFFDPSARIFYDVGSDDENEIDIFNNGNLNLTVDVASLYWPWRFGRSEFFDPWSWGPTIGAGIGTAVNDSEDGMNEASGAPMVLLSAGAMIEYRIESGASFGFELGLSRGFSTDETFDDIDDTAIYAGLRIKLPTGKRSDPPN